MTAKGFTELSREAMKLLEQEAELQEIVRLIGVDALSPDDRLILEGARSIREDFLHQNAFHEIDTYASLKKQYKMLSVCMFHYNKAREALKRGVPFDDIVKMDIRDKIARMRYLEESKLEAIDAIKDELTADFDRMIKGDIENTEPEKLRTGVVERQNKAEKGGTGEAKTTGEEGTGGLRDKETVEDKEKGDKK